MVEITVFSKKAPTLSESIRAILCEEKDLMHLRRVSVHLSLCSPRLLTRGVTFCDL